MRWLLALWSMFPFGLIYWPLVGLACKLKLLTYVQRESGRPVWVYHVVFPEGRLGEWWQKRWGQHESQRGGDHWEWHGVALPCCVILAIDDLWTRTHELRHTDQRFILGPLFEIIGLCLLITHGYRHHPFETDARSYANKQLNLKR